MRAPTGNQPGPVFEHRGAGGWTQFPTLRVGTDIYQTQAPVFGDWALVQLNAATKASSSGINVGLLTAGIAVLVIAGIIIAIRISRTRAV